MTTETQPHDDQRVTAADPAIPVMLRTSVVGRVFADRLSGKIDPRVLLAIGDACGAALGGRAADPSANTPPQDPDHELVDRLFTLHPPTTRAVAEIMDDLRTEFLDLAHLVVTLVPRSSDRTIALRSIHRACMDTIAAVACNQPEPTEGAST